MSDEDGDLAPDDDAREHARRLVRRAVILGAAALVTAGAIAAAIGLSPGPDDDAPPVASTAPAPDPLVDLPQAPDGASSGAVGTPPAGPVTPTLAVGECVLDPVLNAYRTEDGIWHFPGFTVVPCGEPHFGEAYVVASSALEEFDPWDAYSEADEACWAAFESYVGSPYADSALSYEPYYPDEESWLGGDRTIMCVVYGQGELVGTVAGSGR